MNLYPLTWREIPDFKLIDFLNRGGLPEIFLSTAPAEDLKSYVGLYLREEIAREAVTRRIEHFSRFLDVMALQNSEELHYANLASDTGIHAKTIENYVDALEDTLLGFRIPPFQLTQKRKAITRAKFYLFDMGVARVLAKQGLIQEGSVAFGKAFEHFIVLEARSALAYQADDRPLTYWRTKSGFEVDLVIGDETAVEIKATAQPTERHLKGLRALREEKLLKSYQLVCQVDRIRNVDGIEIVPWKIFLERLWGSVPKLDEFI